MSSALKVENVDPLFRGLAGNAKYSVNGESLVSLKHVLEILSDYCDPPLNVEFTLIANGSFNIYWRVRK